MSCLIVSKITVWISMCTASNRHVDSAFQMSPAMKVTCSSGWGDRYTQSISKSCELQHRGSA